MKTRIWLAIGAGALFSLSAVAQTSPEVTLTRIECGTGAKPTIVAERFSDTFAYSKDLALTFTFSCYLIKHGDEYVVWDTGFAPGTNPNAPKVGIVERLAEVKVKPEQVKYVGISHFHGDHTDAGRERGWLQGLDGRESPQGRGPDARQGRLGRRHGEGDPHARPHARALEPPRAPHVGTQFPAERRRRALPRELRIERRAGLQLRPRADGRVARADEEDRREPQRDRDHPARPARHRQAAGFSGCSEVVAVSRNEGGSGSTPAGRAIGQQSANLGSMGAHG